MILKIERPFTVKSDADEKIDVSLVYKSQFWGASVLIALLFGCMWQSHLLWGNISAISGPFFEI